MKYFFILFIGITLSSAFAREKPFFLGCYKTLEFNGELAMPGPRPYRDLTSIYSIERNEFYYSLEGQRPLATTVISLFTGYNGRWSSFLNPLVFEDLGTTEVSEHSFIHKFKGELLHRNRYYGLDKVDFTTEVRLQKYVGIITGTIKQSSKALGRSIDAQIVLKQVPCED